MSQGSRTEKPTERRRQKAREQGQVARSRDLSSTAATIAGFWVLYRSGGEMERFRTFFCEVLHRAATSDTSFPQQAASTTADLILRCVMLPIGSAWLCATCVSLAQGGITFSPAALAPKVSRISPAAKFSQLFSLSSLTGVLRSLVPTAAILWLCVLVFRAHWVEIITLSAIPPRASSALILSIVVEIVWKCCLALLAWAAADYLLVRRKHESDLKMSRDEIREEFKQSEGNPQVKAKIRRLQRQVRRTRMLQQVPKASVVVVNPTHYAIALEYRPDMGAPVCVAKGRNLLALQIKETARWHDIPIVENVTLAHALYRTVQVGQQIPSRLYQAVAEVLAMVFRMQSQAAKTHRS